MAHGDHERDQQCHDQRNNEIAQYQPKRNAQQQRQKRGGASQVFHSDMPEAKENAILAGCGSVRDRLQIRGCYFIAQPVAQDGFIVLADLRWRRPVGFDIET